MTIPGFTGAWDVFAPVAVESVTRFEGSVAQSSDDSEQATLPVADFFGSSVGGTGREEEECGKNDAALRKTGLRLSHLLPHRESDPPRELRL